MKIAASVILFHPDNRIVRNIQSYLHFVEKVFVVDNSEQKNLLTIQTVCDLGNKLVYIENGQNFGVAAALNQCVALAFNEGFEWLLTMDQDSYFNDYYFFQAISNFRSDGTVALFSLNYSSNPRKNLPDFSHTYEKMAITSGSVINIPVCLKLGGFNNDYFIDEVDIEYCFRARRFGFKIVFFHNLYFTHQMGTLQKEKSLFCGKDFVFSQRAPIRYYYITRNRLKLFFTYFLVFPRLSILRMLNLLRLFYRVLIYEKQKKEKFRYIIKGMLHFIARKKGVL